MKAIITVIGKDTIGIIAGITGKLADRSVNILDISQTILSGEFTMVMSVDLEKCTVPFAELKDELAALGDTMGLSVRIQRREIFEAMHNI